MATLIAGGNVGESRGVTVSSLRQQEHNLGANDAGGVQLSATGGNGDVQTVLTSVRLGAEVELDALLLQVSGTNTGNVGVVSGPATTQGVIPVDDTVNGVRPTADFRAGQALTAGSNTRSVDVFGGAAHLHVHLGHGDDVIGGGGGLSGSLGD